MPSGGLSSAFVQFCVEYSAIALLYYDYALTFPMEVKYIWGRKFRLSTFLYIFARYALVANIIYLLTLYNIIEHSCNTGYMISAVLGILGRISVLVVWGMRTFAVYNRNPFVMILLGSIGLACVILNIMSAVISECNWRNNIPIAGRLLSIAMCAFELLSTFLTTTRSIQALRVAGPWREQKGNLNYLILEQGLLYFFSVSGFTLTALVLNFKAPAIQRLLNAYAMPVSGMMTARFLLHLRKWHDKSTLSQTNERHQLTTLKFHVASHRQSSSYIGDFGEDPVRRAERNRLGDSTDVVDVERS